MGGQKSAAVNLYRIKGGVSVPETSASSQRKLSFFQLTWPLFLENMLRMLLGNVNTIMLSRLSDQAVSAVGVSTQIVNLSVTLFSVISTGTAILASQYLGAGHEEEASDASVTALLLNACFGLAASVIVVTFAPNFLRLMNLPQELMPYAVPYLRIVGSAAVIQALASTLSALIRTYGFTRFSLYISVLVNILNVAGGYLVVYQPFGLPSFGVTGIAVSRVLSESCGMLLSFCFLAGRLHRTPGKLLPEKTILKRDIRQILYVGAPAAMEGMSYSMTQTLITSIIATLGTLALTTRIYVNNIVFYVYLLSMSMGSATQIMAGRFAGLREPESADRLCMRNLKIAFVSNTAMSLLFMLLRFPLLRLYTSDPEILRVGGTILLLDVLIESGRALNHIIPSALRGVGDVQYPVVIIILSMWLISLPLCWLVGRFTSLGLCGIWCALALEEWFRGVMMLRRWKSGKWRDKLLIAR